MTSVDSAVHDRVNQFLDTLEYKYQNEHGIDINFVLAVALGSHAWGLNSPDSDYDVGVVYAPSTTNHYAHLGGRKSSLQRDYQGDIDIEVQGWDITKFAGLLYDSNEHAIDTLRSPVVYRDTFGRDALRNYIEESYSPIALYHTYRSIAKNNYRKYLSHHLVDNNKNTYPIVRIDDNGDYLVRPRDSDGEMWIAHDDERYEETQVRQTAKRNLAVYQAAMHADYIRLTGENSQHELPNVDFPTFLAEQAPAVFSSDLIDTVKLLVEKKRNGNSGDTVGDIVGHDYAHRPREIDPDVYAIRKPDQDRLNTAIDTMIASVTKAQR